MRIRHGSNGLRTALHFSRGLWIFPGRQPIRPGGLCFNFHGGCPTRLATGFSGFSQCLKVLRSTTPQGLPLCLAEGASSPLCHCPPPKNLHPLHTKISNTARPYNSASQSSSSPPQRRNSSLCLPEGTSSPLCLAKITPLLLPAFTPHTASSCDSLPFPHFLAASSTFRLLVRSASLSTPAPALFTSGSYQQHPHPTGDTRRTPHILH